MTDLNPETIAFTNDLLVLRYMECINEIADGGYNALLVNEMNEIHQACNTLVKLLATLQLP